MPTALDTRERLRRRRHILHTRHTVLRRIFSAASIAVAHLLFVRRRNHFRNQLLRGIFENAGRIALRIAHNHAARHIFGLLLMPASFIASSFANAMCPSSRSTKTGLSFVTLVNQFMRRQNRPASSARDPIRHSQSKRPSLASPQTRQSAGETPFASSASRSCTLAKPAPPSTKCTCESLNPGTTRLPPNSTMLVVGPAHFITVFRRTHTHNPVAANSHRVRLRLLRILRPDLAPHQNRIRKPCAIDNGGAAPKRHNKGVNKI